MLLGYFSYLVDATEGVRITTYLIYEVVFEKRKREKKETHAYRD